MRCESIASPMRFPVKLMDKIDEFISIKNCYATRPDFILDAIRFSYGKLSEKYAGLYEKTHGTGPENMYVGREKELMKLSGDVLLSNYYDYGPESVQVMVRFPKGLLEKINDNLIGIGFCKNRTDFVRMAVVYKLSYEYELDELWKKAAMYNVELGEKIVNSTVDSILNGMTSKTIFETVKDVSKKIDENDS